MAANAGHSLSCCQEFVYPGAAGTSRAQLVREFVESPSVWMTNRKGREELGKGNVYFLPFGCVSHPVENKINSFIKGARRGR